MNTAILLLAGCAIAFCQEDIASGQESFADRAAPTVTAEQKSNPFFAKLLNPFIPEDQKQPLTAKLRFHLYLRGTIGFFPIFREAAAAGIEQARGDPHEWGGGMEGFAKRFGNELAINAIHNTVTYGFASALHEDNRYFASGKSGKWQRVLHAVLSPLEARREDGSVGPSYSNIVGTASSIAISQAWAPPSRRGVGEVFGNIGFSFAGQAGFDVFREFLPDILHRR